MNKTLDDIYEYFDSLVEKDDADLMFVSSYLRGFITLASAELNSATDGLSPALVQDIDAKLTKAKSELNPNDRSLVSEFWLQLQQDFIVN